MKIGIIGWYGHKNTGDDRLLYCLQRFFAGHNLCILSDLDVAVNHLDVLNQCDYVLIGGGGLIIRGMEKYNILLEELKSPLGCVGISVESYHKDNAGFINLLKEKSEFILVRDNNSKVLLNNHYKVIVSADLSFLYPFDVIDISSNNICGVNFRNWYFWKSEFFGMYYQYMIQMLQKDPSFEKEYTGSRWDANKAFSIIKDSFNDTLIPLPLYFEENVNNDVNELQKFFQGIDLNHGDIYEDFKKCKYIIGMRLHSLIFACQMGIPFISLSYQPKNFSFCRDIGVESLSVNIYELSYLNDAIDMLKHSYLQTRNCLLEYRYKSHYDITYVMKSIYRLITKA